MISTVSTVTNGKYQKRVFCMENLKTINSLINDIWKLIKANPNPVTEAEWEKLLEEGKVIDNNPKYADVEPLARHWILDYMTWLEGKLT